MVNGFNDMLDKYLHNLANKKVAFQGRPGAYSHLACHNFLPKFQAVDYASFEDCFETVENGKCGLAMIPIENSLGGRVSDIHHILPFSPLHIIAEYFQPVDHHLWGCKGATLSDIKQVASHPQALSQCRKNLRHLKLSAIPFADTAGAGEFVVEKGDKSLGAIASSLAGDIYGLEHIRDGMADDDSNVTRFIIMAADKVKYETENRGADKYLTSFFYTLDSIPAALYKSLGGFATNGVNFVKLESYMPLIRHSPANSSPSASFYAEVEGHESDSNVNQALRELTFFTTHIKILGSYKRNISD